MLFSVLFLNYLDHIVLITGVKYITTIYFLLYDIFQILFSPSFYIYLLRHSLCTHTTYLHLRKQISK